MATYTNKSKQSTSILNKLGAHDGWLYNETDVTYNQDNVAYNTFGTVTAWTNKSVTTGINPYQLNIGEGFELLIDSTNKFLIQTGTPWARGAVASSTWTNNSKYGVVITQQDLLIGDGYSLDIGSGFNLAIQESSTGNMWSNKQINN